MSPAPASQATSRVCDLIRFKKKGFQQIIVRQRSLQRALRFLQVIHNAELVAEGV